ncbi:MAG: methionyl-tRNA formyltransferase, partial [Thermomicrobiales bacterium]
SYSTDPPADRMSQQRGRSGPIARSADPPAVIFMGTPEFAVPALRALAASDAADLRLVVTQPDRPAGRGRALAPPPVKVAATDLGLPVLQTPTLRDPDVRARIVGTEPALIVVAAFGMILGKWILDLPTRGCVNLHASILPAYRGANPISSAILQGDPETGVTLMRMDRGLDTGDILDIARTPVSPADTTDVLTARLADLAANLLTDTLDGLLAGTLAATPQPDGATLTRQLVKADGWIDWSHPAESIARRVRAMWPWPRTWTTLPDGTSLQVHRASLAAMPGQSASSGTILPAGLVACGRGSALRLDRIQLAGGKPVAGAAIANISRLAPGTVLGAIGAPVAPPPPLVVPASSGNPNASSAPGGPS